MCAQQLVTQVTRGAVGSAATATSGGGKQQQPNASRRGRRHNIAKASDNQKSNLHKISKPPALSIMKSKHPLNSLINDEERDRTGLNSPRATNDDEARATNDEGSKDHPVKPPSKALTTEDNPKTPSDPTPIIPSIPPSQAAPIPIPIPIPVSSLPTPLIPTNPLASTPSSQTHLLPPLDNHPKKGKKCLILDLDETLVHSSFHPVECDFEISVDIDGIMRSIYVSKRPHVDSFLKECGEQFEVVVFTASLAKYADPLLDILDIHKTIDHRLFRESCTQHMGTYVKDLGRIGRPLSQLIIIDNSPHSYAFNPQNAIPCESWFDDKTDNELNQILETLHKLADPSVDDVMTEMARMHVSAASLDLLRFEERRGVDDEEEENKT